MMWLSVWSSLIPDLVKHNTWKLWDRRMFWRAARSVYGNDFSKAYFVLRLTESTRLLLIECRAKR